MHSSPGTADNYTDNICIDCFPLKPVSRGPWRAVHCTLWSVSWRALRGENKTKEQGTKLVPGMMYTGSGTVKSASVLGAL